MNKILAILLSCICGAAAARAQIIRLDAEALAAGGNASGYVRETIDRMPDGSTLVFPRGVYHFHPEGCAAHYCAITNNDNGVKRTPFPIIGRKNITIDGGGSDFIFHGEMLPFVIERTDSLVLRNFKVDWEYPFHIEADVVAVDSVAGTFDVRVADGFHYRVDGGALRIVGEGWEVEGGQNVFWDRRTGAPYYDMSAFSLRQERPDGNPSYHAEDLGGRRVRIRGRSRTGRLPPAGAVFIDKGRLSRNRVAPAIRMMLSDNITVSDVTLHHAGAIGLIGEFCTDITLTRFNTCVREGGGRLVSTTADATHFSNCKGKIVIRDGIFRHMLDDAANVHGAYLEVRFFRGNTLWVDPVHHHRRGCMAGMPGDSIRIVDTGTMSPVGNAVMVACRKIHDMLYEVVLDRNVEDIVREGFAVENMTWNADLEFRNNRVCQNRARSILISTPGRVVVEGNYFSSQTCAIQIASDASRWYESGAVRDVLIRDNDFGECGYGGGRRGVILEINPQIPDPAAAAGKYFNRNIRFVGNRIRCFESALVYVKSTDGLLFENNTFKKTDNYTPLREGTPVFEIEGSRNIVIRNNRGLSGKELYSCDAHSSGILTE